MNRVAQATMTNSWSSAVRWAIAGLAFALTLLVSSLLFSQSSFAAVGAGGTGGGGGGGSGPYTYNGYGWYMFGTESTGPRDFQNGTAWSSVQDACRAERAESVVAYIVLRATGGPGNSRVYTDVGWSEGWVGFSGNNGFPWLNRSQAQGYFNTLPASQRSGFTIGSNVGWFCYDSSPDPVEWTVNAQSYIKIVSPSAPAGSHTGYGQSDLTAVPGNRLNFKHDLRAQNADINTRVYFTIRGSGFPNTFAPNPADPTTLYHSSVAPNITNNSIFVAFGDIPGYNSSYTIYDVTQNDVGNNLCQRIEWAPTAWNNGGATGTTYRCANVPYNYSLVPTIYNPSDNAIVETDQGTINVDGRVTNNGPTKSGTDVTWRITQLNFAPSVSTIPNRSGGPGGEPCTYFTADLCTTLNQGNEAAGFTYPDTKSYSATNGVIGDVPAGTRICFVMSVTKHNAATRSDPNAWSHSAMSCLSVQKRPKVQVTGSDLIVGRGLTPAGTKIISNVSTSVSTKSSGLRYGSWGEYALIPSGLVTGMGSGSGYAGGTTTATLCGVSYLTLANVNGAGATTCNDSAVGSYSLDTSSPAAVLDARFSTTTGTPPIAGTVNIATLTSGQVRSGAGNIVLRSTGEIPAGKWVVIKTTGTVTIDENIQYTTSPIGSVSQLPQVVIIARNIIVRDTVTNVDAWLIATGGGTEGYLQTCDAPGVSEPNELTSDVCNQRLTVNGPVVANRLLMYRTAGADSAAAAALPAEVFNLRPDAYLWVSGLESSFGRAKAVDTTELPPRY